MTSLKSTSVCKGDWASGNRTIKYAYDANGSAVEKVTENSTSQAVLETVTYEYNLQNRLERVTIDDGDNTDEITEYKYNPDGIRVQSYYYELVGGTTKQNEETKDFLIDAYNHTGYAQVLEEWSGGTHPDITYTIGDDILTQAIDSGAGWHLLYDGHGSTRQLVTGSVPNTTIVDDFSYDGYGVLLQDNAVASSNPGKVGAQATNLLYAGEQFDVDAQQYYLRARYYNPLNGLFNRMDPFAGNNQDPQSLHKYLYAHCNPVNGIDPSGQFFLVSLVSFMWTQGKIIYMRVHKAITAWRHYNRAKSIIKAFSAGAIIISSIVTLLTGSEYPKGDMKLSLPFRNSPHLEDWPNVDITFARSSGNKVLEVKTSFNQKPDPTTIDISPDSDYFGDLTVGATITIDFDDLPASNLALDASKSAPFIKKWPFEAGFSASLSGPSFEDAKLEAGIGLSFEPILDVMSFNVGFPLFTIDKSGIKMGWGTPVWKWGKDK